MSSQEKTNFLNICKITGRPAPYEKHIREQRESLRQECIHAKERLAHTGLHLTQEEVESWLMKLEIGKNVEPPECHI